jgi:hypothetical protein
MPSIFKRGKNWYVQIWHEGKQYVRSSKSQDRDDAERFLERLKAEKNWPISIDTSSLISNERQGHIGCISELYVSTDLMNRGVEVFKSLSSHCSCDLIALFDGKMIRVEVKTGDTSHYKPLVPISRHRHLGKFDLLAVVDRKRGIVYYPAIESMFPGIVGVRPQEKPLRIKNTTAAVSVSC